MLRRVVRELILVVRQRRPAVLLNDEDSDAHSRPMPLYISSKFWFVSNFI
jgi:hypothetical protein